MPSLDKKRVVEIYTASKREQWPYPRIFDALQAAGVEGYVVDVASHTVMYYGHNESCIENSPPGFTGITTEKHFDPAAVQTAIQRNQKQETNYTTFLAELAQAGVVSYHVDIPTRTITYKSSSAQHYSETVPQ
jgi:uncharacterized protein YbcV (DUF1398 family)